MSFHYITPASATGKSYSGGCGVVAAPCVLVATSLGLETHWDKDKTCTVASAVLNRMHCLCNLINNLD